MLTSRWFILVVVLAGVCGCGGNSSNPVVVERGPQSVSFDIQLPPQGSAQEIVDLEFPIDLGVPISRLSSISVSAMGTASAATHECGNCVKGANSSEGVDYPYLVPKQILITVESNDRMFNYRWEQEADGKFVIVDQPLVCDSACDSVFVDGTGIVRVSYGSRSIDAFLCTQVGSGKAQPDFCSLDSGSMSFDENLVFAIEYYKEGYIDNPLWEAEKAAY